MLSAGVPCQIGSVPLPNATEFYSSLNSFHNDYGSIHPFIAVVLCLAGSGMNIVTIAVLVWCIFKFYADF